MKAGDEQLAFNLLWSHKTGSIREGVWDFKLTDRRNEGGEERGGA